ncbi:MAG TPA: hypothetical protein VNZ25_06790, partial [Candidatus Angelobacter sp.]|nr:hypothetical protein [Candidatus Angelobacter sp.]
MTKSANWFGLFFLELALCGLLLSESLASGQGTAFAYQGRLSDGGAPATGYYDLEFSLYDAVTNGNQVGPSLTNSDTLVSNGCFAVVLDFG